MKDNVKNDQINNRNNNREDSSMKRVMIKGNA